MENTGKKQNAFTLIELLVCITIIVLLLVMLLPALRQAREFARRSHCGSNLHQIYLACSMYEHDYAGALPPFHLPPVHYRWPNQSYLAYNKKPVGVGPWNFAFLYEKSYVPEARIFYCPSQNHVDHRYSTYPSPWGSSAPAGSFYIATAYSFNPYQNAADESNLYKRLEDFPTEKILAMDIPFCWSTAHQDENCWGWNILYPAGHTSFVKKSTASSYLVERTEVNTDWIAFAALLRILEH
jgi:prepilin-type N-terminal cleavage/methylation domain-containing protein